MDKLKLKLTCYQLKRLSSQSMMSFHRVSLNDVELALLQVQPCDSRSLFHRILLSTQCVVWQGRSLKQLEIPKIYKKILTVIFWISPDSVVVLGCAETGRWFCVANLVVFSLIVAASIVFCLLKLLLLEKSSINNGKYLKKAVKISHCISLGSWRWIWRWSVCCAIGGITCCWSGLICSCEIKFNGF